jgi:hypothetical protein
MPMTQTFRGQSEYSHSTITFFFSYCCGLEDVDRMMEFIGRLLERNRVYNSKNVYISESQDGRTGRLGNESRQLLPDVVQIRGFSIPSTTSDLTDPCHKTTRIPCVSTHNDKHVIYILDSFHSADFLPRRSAYFLHCICSAARIHEETVDEPNCSVSLPAFSSTDKRR